VSVGLKSERRNQAAICFGTRPSYLFDCEVQEDEGALCAGCELLKAGAVHGFLGSVYVSLGLCSVLMKGL